MKSHVWRGLILVTALLSAPFSRPAYPASPALPAISPAQVPFEQVVGELSSGDRLTRLRAVQLLRDAAYPEGAVPLAALVTDADDAVQFEAIAAELNIFLAQPIATRRRVALIVEKRNLIAAEATFSKGPLALGPKPVPAEVLEALRKAARDSNPRVAVEALYAFGTLAGEPSGSRRRELLGSIGADLASMVGAASPEFRYAAVRVIGRIYERQMGDGDGDETIGDAMVTVLNDKNRTIRGAAMLALGAMRYERALSALVDQFQYFRRGEMAEAALSSIARIGHPAAIPVLAGQLTSKSTALKTIAIEGLARLGDRSRVAGIQAALKGESDESVVLAGSFSAIALSGGTLDPVVEALRRPRLAAQARQYLIDLAPGRAGSFTRHSLDPDVAIRSGIADVLGLAGDVAALPILEPMRHDHEPQVALAAERAIARLVSLKSGV